MEQRIDPVAAGLQAPVETPAAILEARLEAAGRRVSTYLRHMAIPERSRHSLTLTALDLLARDPGENAAQAEAKAIILVRSLLAEQRIPVYAVPGPPLKRSHMKPEVMDRRPWVHVFLRLWRPLWNTAAAILNTSFIDIVLYALLLAGLYALTTSSH